MSLPGTHDDPPLDLPRLEMRMHDDEIDDRTEDDPELDEEFPLGDGTADVEAVVDCPYCGEANEIALDPGGGSMQQYVEDCHVCCQPWNVFVTYAEDGSAEVALTPADE